MMNDVTTENENAVGTPTIIDKNGNGAILIIVTTSKGQVLAFDKNGQMALGFPISLGGVFNESVMALQLDDDPSIEIISFSASGTVNSFEIAETSANSKIIWGMANLTATNNVIDSSEYANLNPVSQLLPKSKFFNYPNPSKNNQTTIRFY